MPKFIMPFGKYKGLEISYIKENDKKYFNWMLKTDFKEPFKTALLDFFEYEKELENQMVDKVIEKIHHLTKEGNIVRYVNVHCVGYEYRLGTYKDGVWIENIMNEHYSLNGKKITKDNFKKLNDILSEYWEKQGKHTEDRGLY